MTIPSPITARRSVKHFTTAPVSREQIELILSAATLAPNHRLTQPWRFYVLGPESRHGYGLALGARKAKKAPDPAAGVEMRERVAREHRELPAMLVVAVVRKDDPQTAEEDFGAAMMAVQNMALTATAIGLGTHIKTGGIMDDPAARAAVGVPEDQRIVAVVNVGVPAEDAPAKPREAATTFTTWVP